MRTYHLGRLAGLHVEATPSSVVGSLLLWVVLSAVGGALLKLAPVEAILGGLLATVLHWTAAMMHQLGHAWAARTTGYPMTGVRLWFLLSTSRYPRDEGELPATIHIRRALGGPVATLAATLLVGLGISALRPAGGLVWWLAAFFFLDGLLIFTLGALLPLGFTDGSTLMHWWGKR